MVQYRPPPDARNLLPPLLACLPTAFASPHPPPVLLPLLSPLLRQRVKLLSADAGPSETWLSLLCWDRGSAEKSERLAKTIESDAFEVHPVSGEIEFRDVNIQYRRLDEETLQAKVAVTDLSLDVIYLWCEGDQEGGGNGWRVSEVTPHNGAVPETWWATIGEADERAGEQVITEALRQSTTVRNPPLANGNLGTSCATDDEDNDEDYWAQYDQTPARTPAAKPLTQPPQLAQVQGRARTKSEAEYFAQYAQVQPEMDNDDPSKDRVAIGESSLHGDVMTSSISRGPWVDEHELLNAHATANPAKSTIDQPSASSPTLVPDALSRMEGSAELLSNSDVAIQQHISTSIKSLFRLSQNTGMGRQEFNRLVRTELDTLEMIDLDE